MVVFFISLTRLSTVVFVYLISEALLRTDLSPRCFLLQRLQANSSHHCADLLSGGFASAVLVTSLRAHSAMKTASGLGLLSVCQLQYVPYEDNQALHRCDQFKEKIIMFPLTISSHKGRISWRFLADNLVTRQTYLR